MAHPSLWSLSIVSVRTDGASIVADWAFLYWVLGFFSLSYIFGGAGHGVNALLKLSSWARLRAQYPYQVSDS